MPITSFSQEELLAGKVVEPGWYHARIKSVGEQLSKDQGSTNYPVEAILIKNTENGSEEFSGVPVRWNFNSKAKGFMIGFIEALGVEVTAGARYELKMAEGKDIVMFVGNKEYQGRIINEVPHRYKVYTETA